MSLLKDIASAINRHSAENGSDTPDFILGEYLTGCLAVFDRTVRAREKCYGREIVPSADYLEPPIEHSTGGSVPELTRDTDEEQRAKNPPRFADLIQRLKGIYTVPVSDGGGLLNGRPTFTRQFEPTPIGLESAAALEFLLERIEWALMHLESNKDIDGNPMSESDAARALSECLGDVNHQ